MPHGEAQPQAALVAMDPHTGFIKAMVGGVDYGKSQFNIAADGRRQPGSSFKPIIYAAAIRQRPDQREHAHPRCPGPPSPAQPARGLQRMTTISSAAGSRRNGRWRCRSTFPLSKSSSLSALTTAIRYANMMGVESPLQPYLTLALGASAVTPLEMACVYSVIDNGGARPSPLCVEEITDNQGNSVYKADPQMETTPISKDALTQVKDMAPLSGHRRHRVPESSATVPFPRRLARPVPLKAHYDVWFDGFTDDLVCTVWAGHPSRDARGHAIYGIPMNGEAFGATICAPIWKRFMIAARADFGSRTS